MDVKKNSIGVICARFQVDDLHNAHTNMIKIITETHGKTIVFLGVSSIIGTMKNPMDFNTRKMMVESTFSDTVVLPLPNCESDVTWSKQLDRRIREVYNIGEVVLYGGRDSFIPHYKGEYKVVEVPDDEKTPSGTVIRERIGSKVINSNDFRKGIIYASQNRYPRVSPTVDIVVTRDKNSSILLIRKFGEPNWRFPGGHLCPDDSSYENAALRVVKNETNLVINDLHYMSSFKVDDWRLRGDNDGDSIMTTLYHGEGIGFAKVSGDIKECQWFDLDDIFQNWFDGEYWISQAQIKYSNPPIGIVKEHLTILEQFIKKFIK